MLTKKIWVEKGFQTSINIAYDLHNDSKIKNFIPTLSSIDVIEDIMLSTAVQDRGRARILIGAYGKGKSHIVLVLMSLLFKKDIYLFSSLLEKIYEYKPELYDFIVDYIKSDKKLLPIIISGSSTSISQSFLSALQSALKNEGLADLMPETHFEAAVNAINLWRESYEDTYKKFLSEINVPINDFIVSLQEYDVNAYEKFVELYPALTSGSTFNPFIGHDIVELYEKVTEKLTERGYSGVYIVYDEFSKYLESSIANTTISDIKLLQDFAEKCDRSDDKQMHLMLISHKDIANYIDKKLPKDKVDGWRGVSGRFKHMSLHNNYAQIYEIISFVIRKEEGFWSDFCRDHQAKFEQLIERFIGNGVLDKDDEKTAEIAVKGCYPLHPVSTFILPRLSEKVAQNERTLFTFLSADSKNTLTDFLERVPEGFSLLTPDYLFDYFEPLLKKEPYTSDVHKLYTTTRKVLQKLENDSLAAKIIKTISLIYIVEQFEKLPPVKDIIFNTFIDSVGDIRIIEDTLNDLIKKEYVIYQKKSNGYLKIKESTGVDITVEIENVIEKTKYNVSVKEVLNKSSYDNYMYPTAYNDENEITRYFDFTFIDSAEFFAIENWDRHVEDIEADGVIYAIIPYDQDDIAKIREAIVGGCCNQHRILFILPIKHVDIEQIVLEYNAVSVLRESAKEDELLYQEYDLYMEDLEEVIGRYIMSYSRPEMGESEYFWKGMKQNIKRKSQISAKLSEICKEMYPYTPIINNETINNDYVTTVAINSRSRLISGLLENQLSPNLGLTGTSQDVSFMRSTLIQTGILKNVEDEPVLTLTPDNENMTRVLGEIREFFLSSSNKGKNFQELYDRLRKPEYGYGIKKGVIPIFIAVVLHFIKKYLVIKNGDEEVRITADLLNSINENPKDYYAYMEEWSEEKALYMNRLEELFSDYIIDKEKDFNTFSYIVSAMTRWYLSLPKYAKELKTIYRGKNNKPEKLPQKYIRFMNGLKRPNINAREFLFDRIFVLFEYDEFTLDIINDIETAKDIYDSARRDLIEHLIHDIKDLFKDGQDNSASLTSIIKDFVEELKPSTLSYLFPNDEHRVLQLMADIGNDEYTFVEKLARTVINLRIDDWEEKTVSEFYYELERIKKSILEYNRTAEHSSSAQPDFNGYKLHFVGEDGKEVVKAFDKTAISQRGKLLYNEIATALNEMGQSISEQEKRQILMEFIEMMCKGG
ncbi:MAG: hypothetical protein ACOX3Q_15255 [Clostridia bacterium]|jgi:hypothetical protein